MIQPWTATCMQVYCHTVNSATNREEAMAIVNKSLDRWITLAMGTARGGGPHLSAIPRIRTHWISFAGIR